MDEKTIHNLFDRYLRGELDSQELDEFLERLNSDQDFKEALEFHEFMVKGIREHEKRDLKKYMIDMARQQFMGNPWSKKWTYVSAAVIVGFGLMYFVIETRTGTKELADSKQSETIHIKKDTNKTKKKAVPDATEQIEQDEILYQEEEKPTIVQNLDLAPEPEVVDSVELGDWMVEAESEPLKLNASQVEEDNLRVKTDTRIYDTLLNVSIKFSKENKPNTKDSLESTLISKKELPVLSEKIIVQFWKSPINYKGYRFDGRKLELFGLDSISNIAIKYRILDANLEVYVLYLKYGNLYFKLEDDNRYHAYIKENSPAIIEELK